jgi:hypothetical protein
MSSSSGSVARLPKSGTARHYHYVYKYYTSANFFAESSIMQACLAANLLSRTCDLKRRLVSMMSFRHIQRKTCTLIAIKPILGGSTDCQAVPLLQSAHIWRSLQALSAHHSVNLVRRFGDVWIGCAGLLDSDTDRTHEADAQHVLQMACDLVKIGKSANMRFTCAIDTGKVVGGFLNGVFNFDMFGPEILWVLAVCESYHAPEIVVSRSSRKLLVRCSTGVVYKSAVIYLPDRKDPERPSVVSNAETCQMTLPPFVPSDNVSVAHNSKDYCDQSSHESNMTFPWRVPLGATERQESCQHSDKRRSGSEVDNEMSAAQWLGAPWVISIFRDLINDVNVNVSSWETPDNGTNNCLADLNVDVESEAFLMEALHTIMFRKVLIDSWFLLRVPTYFTLKPSTFSQATHCDEPPPETETLWSPPIPCKHKLEELLLLCARVWARLRPFVINLFGFPHGEVSAKYKFSPECHNRDTFEAPPVVDHKTTHVAELIQKTTGFMSDEKGEDIEYHPLLSWEDYARSCRSLLKRIADNGGAVIMSIVGVIALVRYQSELPSYYLEGPYRYPIVFSIASSLCSAMILENRDYPLIVHISLNIFRCVTFLSFTIRDENGDEKYMVETVMVMLLGFLGWIFVSFSQRVVYFLADIICIIVVMVVFSVATGKSSVHTMAAIGSLAIALFFVASLFWLCEYTTSLGFLLEHILLPEELKIYEHYKETSRNLLHKFIPKVNERMDIADFAPKCHRSCAILAFHIKAAESIPAVVDVPDVSSFISFLYEFMDDCVVKFGLQSKWRRIISIIVTFSMC